MARSDKRAHLIAVARKLFNRLGYQGAGIDQVIAEAGVAKTTLYRHFRSKEELIVAVLKQMDEDFRNGMRARVDASGASGAQKLLATFDFLQEWFSDDSFFGCPFVSAVGEYGERTSPVFQQAIMHKRLMLAYLEELARGAGLAQPLRVAEAISLLHEGATTVAYISGDPSVAQDARAAAEKLLAAG